MTAENKQFGPECINCGYKNKIDEFCSEGWMQIDTTKKSHPDDTIHRPGIIGLIWICPDCLCKTRVYKELEKETKEIEEQLINIDDLIKQAERELIDNTEGEAVSFNLMASMAHDYYWEAKGIINVSKDMENFKAIEIKGVGKTIRKAIKDFLLNLNAKG